MPSSNEYSIEKYSHPREFPEDVEQLFVLAEQNNFETGQGWFQNFVETVAEHIGQVQFYVLRRHNQAIAALPLLVIHNEKKRTKLHSLSNYYTSFYAPALSHEAASEDLTALFMHLKQEIENLYAIQLAPMESDSESTDIVFKALRKSGFVRFRFFCFRNWFLKVHQNWDDYLASREHWLINTLRRKKLKFARDGGSLEIVTDKDHLETALNEYKTVYQASWKNPEPFDDFIPGLVRQFASRGWVRIGIARLNGIAIAAQIWIVNGGRASIFKLAHDDLYKSYSPGTQLTAALLQHVFEVDRVTDVDYMKGDDTYKKNWMEDNGERIGIIAYNPRTTRGLCLLVKEYLVRIGKRIVQHNVFA